MLRAQKRLQSIERHEEEARRIEHIDKHVGGLKIVRGAVSNDIPEEGPAGAKKKVKVSLNGCYRAHSLYMYIHWYMYMYTIVLQVHVHAHTKCKEVDIRLKCVPNS